MAVTHDWCQEVRLNPNQKRHDSHLMKTQVVLDRWGDIKHRPLRCDHHHKPIQRLGRRAKGWKEHVKDMKVLWRTWNPVQRPENSAAP